MLKGGAERRSKGTQAVSSPKVMNASMYLIDVKYSNCRFLEYEPDNSVGHDAEVDALPIVPKIFDLCSDFKGLLMGKIHFYDRPTVTGALAFVGDNRYLAFLANLSDFVHMYERYSAHFGRDALVFSMLKS